ncbi:MAG TPA: EamA family transporter [Desulfuromonadales bacterium]|nr:EamA family transporter [Desulfuromonadales bacterium]
MAYLLIVSFVWAFSFGLIKGNLMGLPPEFVAAARLFLSFLVFLPLVRRRGVSLTVALQLTGIGVVQYGLMYMAYIASFQYLPAYLVALFTIFTPLYVTFLNDVFEGRFHSLFLVTALLAIVGTGVIVYHEVGMKDLRVGFLLLQGANLCFAFGQLAYRRVMARHQQLRDREIFVWLYLGALLVSAPAAAATTDWSHFALNATQVWTLAYLGILASGVCFFLWNRGARQVDAGALAILNNLKVPLAIACSTLFFGEVVDVPRLAIGGGLLLVALVLNEVLTTRQLRRAV